MVELVRWAFFVWGATYLLTQTKFFKPYRKGMALVHPWAAYLAYCPPCTSVWVGFLVAGFLWPWSPDKWFAYFESAVAAVTIGSIIGHSYSDGMIAYDELGLGDPDDE